MNDKKKKAVRILSLILAVILVASMVTGVISSLTLRSSAAPSNSDILRIEANGRVVEYVPKTKDITVIFRFKEDNSLVAGMTKNTDYTFSEKDFTLNSYWNKDGAKLILRNLGVDVEDNTKSVIEAKVTNITHNGNLDQKKLTIQVNSNSNNNPYIPDTIEDFFIPDNYFEKGSSGGAEKDTISPDPVIENVIINDKDGTRLTEVNKDTPPFTLIVTYLDYGLEKTDLEEIPDSALSAYVTAAGGFKLPNGLRGMVEPLRYATDGTPRFQVIFRNLTYNEEENSTNTMTIKVKYEFDGDIYTATLDPTITQAKPKKEDEKEKDKIDPLKPYIIVSSYSYGKNEIIAGTEFPLNVSYTNTSSNIPIENIIMTVTTPEELSIASSSNTSYVPALGVKSTLGHTVELLAKPTAKVGSAELTIEFKYQYVDPINKKREEGTTTEKIAIPISQIDRFDLDPITEMSDVATVGEPFYVTVSFINRGKVATYNISAKATSKKEISSASQHYGNLDPGKADSIELAIIANQPGPLTGDVVLQYEDENTNQKELRTSYSITVEEPYVPDMDEMYPNGMDETPPEPKPTPLAIVLCSIGALLVATPIGLYFMKKVKNKESEGFDEDF